MTVFLDIGATLVTGPNEGPAKRLARELGLSSDVKARIGAAMMTECWTRAEEFLAWLESAFGDEWRQTSHRAVAQGLWDVQAQEARAIAGGPGIMKALLDANLSVGLISNIWHPYFECSRQLYDGLFERAAATAPQILSYRAGTAKPGTAIYREALKACGLEAGATVMVGDTYETDIAPAMALGMATVWVLHRPEAEHEHFEGVRRGDLPCPDLMVSSITEVTPDQLRTVMDHKRRGRTISRTA